jgi:tetratricopeptide (TPR) repeat protein
MKYLHSLIIFSILLVFPLFFSNILGIEASDTKAIDTEVQEMEVPDMDVPGGEAAGVEAMTAFSMGYYFLYNDELDKAKAQFESCLDLLEEPPAALFTLLSEVSDMLGKKQEAEDYASLALEIDPENQTALQFKALFLMNRGAYGEALPYLERLRERKPYDLQILLSLSETYANLEQEDNLIDVYQDILLIRPDFVDVRLNIGYLYTKKGLLYKAMDEYEKVLEIDPENEKAIFYLTYIYLSEGNSEKALSYFQKLDTRELLNDDMLEDYAANLFIENQNPQPVLNRIMDMEHTGSVTRAIVLYLKGDIDDAKKLFEEGLKEDQNSIAAYVGLIRIAEDKKNVDMEKKWRFVLAGVYYDLNSYEKSLEEARKVKNIDPSFLENRYLMGDIFRGLGKTENAIQEYEYFKEHSSEKGDVYIKLGICYDDLGDHLEAVSSFQKAAELSPGNADLYYYLGIEFRVLEKYDKAISSFHKAIDLGGDNAYFYFNLGVSYERAGKIESAIRYLDRSVQLDDTNIVALNYLGYLLADEGIRLDEAKSLIEKALKVDPENGAYLDSIGWVYFKLYDYAKAKEYLEKAIQRMDVSVEENYVVYDHLGDTYRKLGLLVEAINAWEKALELKHVGEIQEKIEKARSSSDVSR